ncbi:MAG TPA: carbon monoxide dehydrogenase subunit G [Gemmatimonadaceae bacterium]|nr:carbon monoxide dehydrogenase subunit G [Gemmatimonadaceae bacterium]
MKIAGEYSFAAPRAVVWEALQDPKVLAAVLPGAERLDLVAPDEYEGKLKIKVGPVQGDFTGKVKLQDLQPPASYTMAIDGQGAQGFVKATASIALAEDGPSATRMRYDSEAQVGGRIASVGQRLVESSARAIVKQSLEGLDAAIRARAAAAQTVAAAGGSVAEASAAAEAALAPIEAAKPSQAAFAAGVAREVAKEVIPPGVRRVIIAVVAIVVILWILRQVL